MDRKQFERAAQKSLWLLAWRSGSRKDLDYGTMVRMALVGLLGAVAGVWGVLSLKP